MSLELQNPPKTSEKWVILIAFKTVSLHILCTANQETASVALRATCRAPARIWLAVIDFQSEEIVYSRFIKIPLG